MQTKTYFANNVPSALEVARQELGADALLVTSRPTPAHARHFGKVEVTFAWDPSASNPSVRKQAALAPRSVPRNPARPSGNTQAPGAPRPSEMDEIRQQLSALTFALGCTPGEGNRVPAEETTIAERLTSAGLRSDTAREIALAAAEAGGDHRTAAINELARRIPASPFEEMKTGENRTLAFFGPPGRGKTTSLVKLAVGYGLARRIPVRIYSVGAHCVGGEQQLARYAAILGAPFHACESVENLNLALNGDPWRGLVLIDTPGFSPSSQGDLNEMGRFFASRQEVEKHLVLRADARTADTLHMISRFAELKPSRLLFTGMDEATTAGSLVDALMGVGIAATFLGTGPQIPDDLEEADAMRLARSVWAAGTSETSNAAVMAPPAKYARAAA